MKEVRFFYVPNADSVNELPEEEARHAVRVLRMEMGDEMMLMDGAGTFYRAIVTEATKKRCLYRIEETLPQERQWMPHLHLAMAPTKNMDRTEWFAEKATEIGFDELTFLKCRWSERTVIKTERIEKILVSAMKQSHKAWKPVLNEMTDFKAFLQEIEQREKASGKTMQKFICHCYDDADPAMACGLAEGCREEWGRRAGDGGTRRGFLHRRGEAGGGKGLSGRQSWKEPTADGDRCIGGGAHHEYH